MHNIATIKEQFKPEVTGKKDFFFHISIKSIAFFFGFPPDFSYIAYRNERLRN